MLDLERQLTNVKGQYKTIMDKDVPAYNQQIKNSGLKPLKPPGVRCRPPAPAAVEAADSSVRHPTGPLHLLSRRRADPVDGKLDEPSWLAAPRSTAFVDIVTGEPAWFERASRCYGMTTPVLRLLGRGNRRWGT